MKREEEFVGILTIADYLQAPRKLVIDCLRPKARIDCESELSSTCRQMLASAETVLPVFRNEVFFGVITTVRRQSRRKRILLLDDNDALREMLATYFNRIGHEIEVARDAEEALRLFRQAARGEAPTRC